MRALINLDSVETDIETKESYATIKKRVCDERAFIEVRSSKGKLILLNKQNIVNIQEVGVKKK